MAEQWCCGFIASAIASLVRPCECLTRRGYVANPWSTWLNTAKLGPEWRGPPLPCCDPCRRAGTLRGSSYLLGDRLEWKRPARYGNYLPLVPAADLATWNPPTSWTFRHMHYVPSMWHCSGGHLCHRGCSIASTWLLHTDRSVPVQPSDQRWWGRATATYTGLLYTLCVDTYLQLLYGWIRQHFGYIRSSRSGWVHSCYSSIPPSSSRETYAYSRPYTTRH